MALVGEIVARFKAETADYQSKVADLKAKNRSVAEDFVKTAGDAEKAIATLMVARRSGNDLSEFGIDKRNISGVITQIKEIEKEANKSADGVEELARALRKAGDTAGGLGDVTNDVFDALVKGDVLKAFEKLKKGIADIKEGGELGAGLKNALAAGIAAKLGEVLADWTKKAVELKQQFREGKIGAGDVVDQLASGLPILGGWYQVGRNINDLFDDTAATIDRQNAALERGRAIIERTRDIQKEAKEHAADEAKRSDDMFADAKTAALRNSGQAAAADAKALADKLDRDMRDFKEAEERRLAEAQKELGASTDSNDKRTIEQRLSDARERVDRAKTPADRQAAKETLQAAEAEFELVRQAREKLANESERRITDREIVLQAAYAQEKIALDKRVEAEQKSSFGKNLKDGFTSILGKFQANPYVQAAKDQLVGLNKAYERMKQDALAFAERVKTPAEKMQDDLNKAIAANRSNPGTFTKDMLGKYFGDQYTDLLDQQKSLEASLGQRVYNLPDVKEVRGGTLYAAPTSDSKEQLKKLEEIRNELAALRKAAKDNGVNIEVYK